VFEFFVRRFVMKREVFLASILLAGVVVATWSLAGTSAFNGFKGAFLRVFIGYMSLIALAHFIYLFLPKLGIGADVRKEVE
jgi:hypothetical protein